MLKKKAASKASPPKAKPKKKIRDLTARELNHIRGGAERSVFADAKHSADAKHG